MLTRFAMLVIMLVLGTEIPSLAAGKNEHKGTVSFHIETDANDNPKMIFPQMTNGKTRYFRRMPEIMINDVVSFTPFPSEFGGGDYGMVFLLKANASRRLSAITNANQGKWMISIINGRVVDGVLIDKQVDDGRSVIWKGVTLADIELFDTTMPRIGQEKGKKK